MWAWNQTLSLDKAVHSKTLWVLNVFPWKDWCSLYRTVRGYFDRPPMAVWVTGGGLLVCNLYLVRNGLPLSSILTLSRCAVWIKINVLCHASIQRKRRANTKTCSVHRTVTSAFMPSKQFYCFNPGKKGRTFRQDKKIKLTQMHIHLSLLYRVVLKWHHRVRTAVLLYK